MRDAGQSNAVWRRGLAIRGVSGAVALVLVSASLGAVPSASAQTKPAAPKAAAAAKPAAGAPKLDKKAAGAAFKKGKEAFDKKEWAEAKTQFMTAEETIPAALAEYYIARCHEELGESADAASWFQKSLDSTGLKDEQSADAKARLEALKGKPTKVKVTSEPAGATILVDGKPIAEKTPAEIELTPGQHKVTLQSAGHKDSEQAVDVAPFTGGTVNATLETAPAAPAEDPFAKKPEPAPAPTPVPAAAAVAPAKADLTWVYITGAATIVAVGVGTVFGIQALSSKSKFDEAIDKKDAQGARDARDDGTRNSLISDMGFGIGITLGVTCLVLFVTGGGSEEKPAPKAALLSPKVGHGYASSPGPVGHASSVDTMVSSFRIAPMIGAPKGGSVTGASVQFNF